MIHDARIGGTRRAEWINASDMWRIRVERIETRTQLCGGVRGWPLYSSGIWVGMGVLSIAGIQGVSVLVAISPRKYAWSRDGHPRYVQTCTVDTGSYVVTLRP